MANKPMKQKKKMRDIQKGCMVTCVLGGHFFLHLSRPHPADGFQSGGFPHMESTPNYPHAVGALQSHGAPLFMYLRCPILWLLIFDFRGNHQQSDT